jgi:hypothetical protein
MHLLLVYHRLLESGVNETVVNGSTDMITALNSYFTIVQNYLLQCLWWGVLYVIKFVIKWLWIFLILIGLEGSLLPLTELHVHRAILRVRLINLMSQLVRTQI